MTVDDLIHILQRHQGDLGVWFEIPALLGDDYLPVTHVEKITLDEGPVVVLSQLFPWDKG